MGSAMGSARVSVIGSVMGSVVGSVIGSVMGSVMGSAMGSGMGAVCLLLFRVQLLIMLISKNNQKNYFILIKNITLIML